MGTVLALKKLWKCYYFSSAEDFSNFTLINNAKEDPAKYELLLMHVLSSNDFICLSGGVSVSREEKTHQLADYSVAQKVLHPCHKQGLKNCTEPTCLKCLRALGVFDYYDKLDLFQEVFDIDRYKKDKKHYMWRLAQARNDFYIRPVFFMMQEKYPEEMKKAIANYDNWIKPISRKDFDEFHKAYIVAVKLFQVDNLRDKLRTIFGKENNKIYVSGKTNIGDSILSMISDNYKIVTYKTGKVEDCSAVFIEATVSSEINKIKKTLKTSLPTYTIYDIEKLVCK